MHYYQRNLGDMARDTAHLSALEMGVYDLLMDRYYVTETPLSPEDVYRVGRARSRDERGAVDYVLEQFFQLLDGVYRHTRIDAEIARYQQKEPERAQKKQNAAERQRRTRERRAELFDMLRQRGVVPSFKTSTRELEALLHLHDERATSPARHALVTRDDTANNSLTHELNKKPYTAANPQQGLAREQACAAAAVADGGAEQPAESVPPDETRPDHGPPPDPVSMRALEIACLLRPRGVALTAQHVTVRRWAADPAVTDAALLAALQTADQRRNGSAQPVNAGLMDTLLADQARAPPPRRMAAQFVAARSVFGASNPDQEFDHDPARPLDGPAVRLD